MKHNYRCISSLLTPTNCCPNCNTIFASRTSASHHLQSSLEALFRSSADAYLALEEVNRAVHVPIGPNPDPSTTAAFITRVQAAAQDLMVTAIIFHREALELSQVLHEPGLIQSVLRDMLSREAIADQLRTATQDLVAGEKTVTAEMNEAVFLTSVAQSLRFDDRDPTRWSTTLGIPADALILARTQSVRSAQLLHRDIVTTLAALADTAAKSSAITPDVLRQHQSAFVTEIAPKLLLTRWQIFLQPIERKFTEVLRSIKSGRLQVFRVAGGANPGQGRIG